MENETGPVIHSFVTLRAIVKTTSLESNRGDNVINNNNAVIMQRKKMKNKW